MSDTKRAQLIPLPSQKDSDRAPKEPRKTVRISVVLAESTENLCPEYNYKDELAVAKKKSKKRGLEGSANALPNGLNRLDELDGDDDDDVRRIARQMEAKYGTGPVSKKKRKGRRDDYADIGMGYDESDSFIDNTDGYDEMIPQNVTTLHGGFYINSGALEFKTDDEANSDFSSSSDDEAPKKASRKRVIESSDETDREDKTEPENKEKPCFAEKKRKLQNGGNGMQQAIKKKLLNPNKIYIKKRRPLDPQKKTVKELLREKREDLNMSIPQDLTADTTIVADAEPKDKRSNVSLIIESVVKASGVDESKPVVEKNDEKITPPAPKVVGVASSDGESSHDTNVVKGDIKLPENLQPDIVDIILNIRTAVLKKNAENLKPFSPDVNSMILRLERKCKCLGKPSILKIYDHLSVFFKCKTEKLMRRAKILVLDDENKKLRSLLAGLHTEIGKIMPSLLENHEKESQKVLQKKFSQEGAENEEVKSLRLPKRRFQWNDVTKKYLKDILLLKKRCCILEGKTKDQVDETMLVFLRIEIQTLWPEGWMSMNALNKIYTTYADSKKQLNSNNGSNSQSSSPIPPPLPKVPRNLAQTFNNSNLSITPIPSPIPKPATVKPQEANGGSAIITAAAVGSSSTAVANDLTISKTDVTGSNVIGAISATVDLTVKSLPEKSTQPPCDISPSPPPPKDAESKVAKGKTLQNDLPKQLPLICPPKKLDSGLVSIDDSVIIIDSTPPPAKISVPSKSHVKVDDSTYQVIDLSEKPNQSEQKLQQPSMIKRDFGETTISPCNSVVMTTTADLSNSSNSRSHVVTGKHHDISITPSLPMTNSSSSSSSTASKSDHQSSTMSKHNVAAVTAVVAAAAAATASKPNVVGNDDIQKVMEGLKVLQKMSSPKKTSSSSSSPMDASQSSAAVSVIAVNKSFAPKSIPFTTAAAVAASSSLSSSSTYSNQPQATNSSTMHRVDYPKSDYNTSFQDEFQKQLFSALNHISTSTPKTSYNSIDRYPHIASSGSNLVAGDKYFQNSNNNYATQSSNGHKSSTSAPQTGTYSILDDMFANLLTQYGYAKEATTSNKSHHHHHHHHHQK